MIVFINLDDPPEVTAKTLWRELGPELCLQVGLELAERGRGRSRFFVMDGCELREVHRDA